MSSPKISVAAGLIVAIATTSAAAEESYPIWWSPRLELESLEKIDERLQRRIPEEDALTLYKTGDSEAPPTEAATCAALIELTDAGYTAQGRNNQQVLAYHLSSCRAIVAVKSARPARTSHLRDFVLDQTSLNLLPALVLNDALSCQEVCLRVEANRRGIPMGRFGDFLEITAQSDTRLDLESFASKSSIEILGRGDFDGDGLDDLLVLSKSGAVGQLGGRWGATDLLVVSREAPDSVLFVVGAEEFLCNDYTCMPPYDLPAPRMARADAEDARKDRCAPAVAASEEIEATASSASGLSTGWRPSTQVGGRRVIRYRFGGQAILASSGSTRSAIV